MGRKAAKIAANVILHSVNANNHAYIILATGASQFSTLKHLVHHPIPWKKVTMYHLDEYIGIDAHHPASFRKYLTDRFLKLIDFQCTYHMIDGQADPQKECARLKDLLTGISIDLALIGIGENGHLAFNDPPADFETTEPYLVVQLDNACRQQQCGEGWFESIEDVPSSAISMSIKQILMSTEIVASVPDKRKAEAVRNAIEGPINPQCPASILQQHESTHLILDRDSASLLRKE